MPCAFMLAGALNGVRHITNNIVSRVADLGIEHRASDVAGKVTISVGAAVIWPDASIQADRLVRTADDALYEAKSQGRNRAIVYQLDDQLHTTTTLRMVAS